MSQVTAKYFIKGSGTCDSVQRSMSSDISGVSTTLAGGVGGDTSIGAALAVGVPKVPEAKTDETAPREEAGCPFIPSATAPNWWADGCVPSETAPNWWADGSWVSSSPGPRKVAAWLAKTEASTVAMIADC